MTRGLADTSLFVARETGRILDVAAVPDELAVSAITIGELRAGVLVALDTEARARRLATLTHALAMQPVPVDDDVAASWPRFGSCCVTVANACR
jgi:predicted nucleic acid-binding protein